MTLKSRAAILAEKMVDCGTRRLPRSLQVAITWWANNNGYSFNRACTVLLERAIRAELEALGVSIIEEQTRAA